MHRPNWKIVVSSLIGTIAGVLVFINEIVTKQEMTKLGLISVTVASISAFILWMYLSPNVPTDSI